MSLELDFSVRFNDIDQVFFRLSSLLLSLDVFP